jgi:hypothetical protein
VKLQPSDARHSGATRAPTWATTWPFAAHIAGVLAIIAPACTRSSGTVADAAASSVPAATPTRLDAVTADEAAPFDVAGCNFVPPGWSVTEMVSDVSVEEVAYRLATQHAPDNRPDLVVREGLVGATSTPRIVTWEVAETSTSGLAVWQAVVWARMIRQSGPPVWWLVRTYRHPSEARSKWFHLDDDFDVYDRPPSRSELRAFLAKIVWPDRRTYRLISERDCMQSWE